MAGAPVSPAGGGGSRQQHALPSLASVIPEEEELVDQVILIPEEKEDRRLPPRWYMANMVRHAKGSPANQPRNHKPEVPRMKICGQ